MKRFLITAWLCVQALLPGYSQSITPTVVASGGTAVSAGGVQLSFTVGELAVSTGSAGGSILTEGFNQPSIAGQQGAGSVPNITVTANLTSFSTTVGTPSSSQSFTVSGSGLTQNISITPPSMFQVSLSSSSGFGSSVSLSPTGDSVAPTFVYVRYNPSAAGPHNGNIVLSSAGASSRQVFVAGNTGSPVPTVSASVSSLSAFSTSVGTPSSSQNFTVSGYDLTGNLVVNAPGSFEVSLTASSGYGSSVSFTPAGGIVNSQNVYVRYIPSSAGPHSGNVICSSTGATNQTVSVSGNTIAAPTPKITVSTNNLGTFSTFVGTPSLADDFDVSGTDLTGSLVVTAPAQFQVSLSQSTGFGGSVNLTPLSGTVGTTTIYVRYNPTSAGTHNGKVTCASAGATTQEVSVKGDGTNSGGPAVTATSVDSAFKTVVGTPSAPKAIAVAGTNLFDDIDLVCSAPFEISLNSTSGFGGTLTLAESGGTVATTIVYVRYNPTAQGVHSGSISITSSGAFGQVVDLDGYTYTIGAIGSNPDAVLSIYPNPANGWIKIAGAREMTNITLSDAQGRHIVCTVQPVADGVVLQLPALPAGIYLCTVQVNSILIRRKILVQ